MLRNRSRTVTSKKALMADRNSLFSPTTTTTNSSFLNSPRFLNGFLSKNLFDPETPTSILDNKNNSPTFVNPFGYDKIVHKTENPSRKLEPQPQQAIGLALIDSIIEEKNDDDDGNLFKPVNRMVLFGSKLKVQIPSVGSSNPPPPPPPFSPSKSPESPGDFGIKTRHSQLMMSPFSSTTTPVKEFSRQLSLKEMELSEDYTCVISHGPNYKKTTHIFDDCVVESCDDDCDESVGDEKNLECGFEVNDMMNSVNVNFLSFCYNCQRSLEQGQDIYMYRGDKAFCSQECRGQEILFELKNPDSD